MTGLAGKWRNLSFLCIAALLAMALWFSASAVIPQLTLEWQLDDSQRSWMTMSVQIGFVVGALLSAIFNLADRLPAARLFAGAALAGAAFNAVLPAFDPGPTIALWARFLTGVSLAGVYPPAMKLVASWCRADRGFGIGILIGALAFGSAMPHLINAVPQAVGAGLPAWRPVLWSTSAMALLAAVLAFLFVRTGPFLSRTAPFNWRFAVQTLSHRPTRMANFGYLGHMWELYAMWTWAPLFLIASYAAAGWSERAARFAGFGTIAIGAIGCVVAGSLADRLGRTTIAGGSLLISGACCLIVGNFFDHPALLTLVCLVWGFAVVADSAQFSAAVSELTDARYVGTALTLQTSLGFLLTLLSIFIIPHLVERVGWNRVFIVLALGPAFGIWSMLRLRALPEATLMASGNR